jgi:hypothetical protein
MTYQTKLSSDGDVITPGYRECERRYAHVRWACSGLGEQFTVCDIGANWCYFGIRITAEFPGVSVVAYEYRSARAIADHLETIGANRITLMPCRLSLADMWNIGRIRQFDLVLALSVIHQLEGSLVDRISAIRSLGKRILIEFPGTENRRVTELYDRRKHGGAIVGHGASHQDEAIMRPIVYFKGS